MVGLQLPPAPASMATHSQPEPALPALALVLLSALLLSMLVFSISCTPPKTPLRTGPSMRLEKDLWDFGTIERGEKAATRIEVTNDGADTLRFSLTPSCDCLTAKPESALVPPRASTSISLSFLGYEIKEATSKTLYVDSNDPIQSRISVTIRGKVVQGQGPDIGVIPNPLPAERAQASSDQAGPSRAGSGEEAFEQAILKISNHGREDLIIKEVRCFGCVSDWTEMVVSEGHEAVLQLEILPIWPDARWIEIESNDAVFPLKKISIVEIE